MDTNGAVTLRVRGPAFGCVQNTQLNVIERICTRVQRTRTHKNAENARERRKRKSNADVILIF